MSVSHPNCKRLGAWESALRADPNRPSVAQEFADERDSRSQFEAAVLRSAMAGEEGASALRAAFAANAAGVAVVTALTPLGAFAMTTNRVTALSDQPPLMGWTLPRNSRRAEAFSQARHFAVHFLAHDQQDMALHFARRGRIDEIQDLDYNAHNVAKLPGCLAEFECRLESVQRFGDHLMIVGKIEAFEARPGEALVFHHQRYDQTLGKSARRRNVE